METYVLDEHGRPKRVADIATWALQFKEEMRKVARYEDPSGAFVSTVFLGMDHAFGMGGPPILWETMIFGDERFPDYQERYSSKQEALAGHELAVALVKQKRTL